MSAPRPLSDAADRARAERELGTCFAVEAAAGSGKTTVLVTRLLGLGRSGAAAHSPTSRSAASVVSRATRSGTMRAASCWGSSSS